MLGTHFCIEACSKDRILRETGDGGVQGQNERQHRGKSAGKPKEIERKQSTYRNIDINGEKVEFSEGFTDLHTKSYREILEGRGFGLTDVRQCIETVHTIQVAKQFKGKESETHPMALRL